MQEPTRVSVCVSMQCAATNMGSLMVEVPIERQLLESILETGPEGKLSVSLFEGLGLTAKKHGPQLNEMIKKYGLQVCVCVGG